MILRQRYLYYVALVILLFSAIMGQDQQQQLSQQSLFTLRYNYTNLERLSTLAKQFETMQSDCSLSSSSKPYTALFWFRNTAGLGSDLHLYSMALCHSLQRNNVRLRSIGNWTWRDDEQCNNHNHNNEKVNSSSSSSIFGESPMQCYFPQADTICSDPKQRNRIINITTKEGKISRHSCDRIIQQSNYEITPSIIRSATTEFLFTRVSNIVQNEAIRQLHLVFHNLTLASNNTTDNIKNRSSSIAVPSNLITVHIRWGDKRYETGLIPISKYINAVQQILDQRRNITITTTNSNTFNQNSNSNNTNATDDNDEVNIFLATEDPNALREFIQQKPKHWNVYIDQYYIENLPYRKEVGNVYNAHLRVAEQLNGRTGLIALGSLLVAMESNDYVLTTKSNWSRLINEIRKSIINPRCNNCTIMIDLNPGEV